MRYSLIFSFLLLKNSFLLAQNQVLESIGIYSIELQEKHCKWQLLDNKKNSLVKGENIQKMYFVEDDLLYVQENFIPKYYLLVQDKWQLLSYEKVTVLYEDYLLVKSASNKGLVSKKGQGILPIQYQEIINLHKYLLLKQGEKWYLWSKENKQIALTLNAEPYFLEALKRDGVHANFLFEKGDMASFIKVDLLTLEQEKIELPLHEYLTIGLWANTVQKEQNINLQNILCTVWIVQKNNNFGLVNDKRVLLLPVVYEHIEMDKNYPDFLHVKEKGYWGIWNSKTKKWLVEINKNQQIPYSLFNEKTWAKKEKDTFVLFSSTKAELSLKADVYKVLNTNYLAFAIQNKWGIFNLQSQKIIIEPQYNSIELVHKDFFKVSHTTKEKFIINSSNKKISCWE